MTETSSFDQIIENLSHEQRLTRCRQLENLPPIDQNLVDAILNTFYPRMIVLNTLPWYQMDGIMLALIKILQNHHTCLLPHIAKLAEDTLTLLDHSEVRLRENSGKLLAALVKQDTKNYQKIHAKILDMIQNYMIREDSGKVDPKLVNKLQPVPSKPSGERVNTNFSESGSTAEEIFHESAGWRHLETSLKAMQSCLEVIKNETGTPEPGHLTIQDLINEPSIDSDKSFLETIYKTLVHSNRFVRQTGYEILQIVVDFLVENERFLIQIARGLSDNWSQVRMAASTVARRLIQIAVDEKYLTIDIENNTSSLRILFLDYILVF